jgi:hypothetical protein
MNSLVDEMNESRIHSSKSQINTHTHTHNAETAGDFNSLVTAIRLF